MSYLTLPRFIALLSALLVALALPAIATADGDDVIRDCARDGDLDKDYSDEELEEANRDMPSDIAQYSDCRDAIRQAQAGGRGNSEGSDNAGGGSGAGGSGGGGDYRGSVVGNDVGGSEGATPSDVGELDVRKQAAESGAEPDTAASIAAGADAGGDDDGLPTAALIAIVLLGLAAIGGGIYLLRDSLPPSLTSRLPGTSR
jgi:hypothetical protein